MMTNRKSHETKQNKKQNDHNIKLQINFNFFLVKLGYLLIIIHIFLIYTIYNNNAFNFVFD